MKKKQFTFSIIFRNMNGSSFDKLKQRAEIRSMHGFRLAEIPD